MELSHWSTIEETKIKIGSAKIKIAFFFWAQGGRHGAEPLEHRGDEDKSHGSAKIKMAQLRR